MKFSWHELNHLEKEYGDSFFLLDLEKFRQNYCDFLKSFQQFYHNTTIGYSYKTNYIPQLCKVVQTQGGYAEVVSQMEYELALYLGIPPHQIIFNGPLKRPHELESALLGGTRVNLDSFEEVRILQSIAERYPDRPIAVGLRCNFDIGEDRISRFGFDVHGHELTEVFSTLSAYPNLTVEGLHCHFSSATRSVASYAQRTQTLIELSQIYFPDHPPRYLDLGGGFFGSMPESLQRQFPCPIPTYAEYAAAIAPQLAQAFDAETGPELILEPGVALVSDVLQFVAKVVGLKTVRSRQIALTTGSIHNVKPTLNRKTLSMQVYRSEPPANQSLDSGLHSMPLSGAIDVVGYTCMEHDCLYEDYKGTLGVNDYLVFENLGAYTIVFKPPFIQTSPPIVIYHGLTKTHTLCKRRETMKDVFATYLV